MVRRTYYSLVRVMVAMPRHIEGSGWEPGGIKDGLAAWMHRSVYLARFRECSGW